MTASPNRHAKLIESMKALGIKPQIISGVSSLYRGFVMQKETNSRLWHDNMALRKRIAELEGKKSC